MADLIDEPCPSCHRKSVEVEFKYQHPLRLGIVWGIALLIALGFAKVVPPLIPDRHEWRLTLGIVGRVLIVNVLRGILEPRIAKRSGETR